VAEGACAPLEDQTAARCVRAERALLARLSGSCTVPIAAYAVEEDGVLRLRAALGGPIDGGGRVRVIRAEGKGPDPDALGAAVAEDLLRAGAGPLLEASRTLAGGLSAPRRTSSAGVASREGREDAAAEGETGAAAFPKSRGQKDAAVEEEPGSGGLASGEARKDAASKK
jgi:hypothetical protein